MLLRHARISWTALLTALLVSSCQTPPPVPRYAVSDRGGDRDGDGAADIDDACPDLAEDGLPPRANDGCPADDPDNDGIARASDRCPDAKEDRLPPSPGDGCPSDDRDGDGVGDSRDKCPDKREDNILPDPSDGCPSPDADQDGVADTTDRCPQQRETYNGYRDDDGCPDEVPSGGAIVFDDASSTIYVPPSRKIEFDVGSAELAPSAQQTVADVAKVLKEHPEISRLEIEGHASRQGDERYNVDLTERRARAVAAALQRQGVPGSRLVAVGYGEYCPAVETADEVDEPQNRRVILKTVVVNGVWQSVQRGCWTAKVKGIDPTSRRSVGVPAARSPQQPQPEPQPGVQVPATGGG